MTDSPFKSLSMYFLAGGGGILGGDRGRGEWVSLFSVLFKNPPGARGFSYYSSLVLQLFTKFLNSKWKKTKASVIEPFIKYPITQDNTLWRLRKL